MSGMQKLCEEDYINALEKAHEDESAFKIIETFIKNHFALIEHMKETSLYDVYMYEERITKNSIEPMEILAYDNKKLKKEVNELRKQLGLSKKYR